MIKFHRGDCLDVLARLPAGSAHCCITSPPYFGLRDYGVDGQLGLEPTPDAYVATMVRVFREVYRVLRNDGTCWLNLGDSYAGGGGFAPDAPSNKNRREIGSGMDGPFRFSDRVQDRQPAGKPPGLKTPGLKPKDLIGIPWRVALALQADGWYLRSDIIWHKPNPMPESVRDRPTKSHEYLFLLAKSERYFWDQEAVREPHVEMRAFRGKAAKTIYAGAISGGADNRYALGRCGYGQPESGRNVRSVWTIATKSFRGAHFATFPPALVERCVKAGTSERGCCPTCGAPWERVVERTTMVLKKSGRGEAMGEYGRTCTSGTMVSPPTSATIGWRPSCTCPAHDPIPATVLDPFAGAGTVGLVCDRLGRDHLGIELNAAYVTLARRRIAAERRKHSPTAMRLTTDH